MRVRFVIPVLNNLMITIQAVHSLMSEMEGQALDIVIVDNGSDDDTLSHFAHDHGKGVRVLRNPERGHYSRSVNMGASAPGEYDALVVVNNDVIFGPGSVAALCSALSPFSRLALPMSPACAAHYGLTPPVIERPADLRAVFANVEAVRAWWALSGRALSGTGLVGHPYVKQGGYCFAIERAFWDELGGFDEGYDLFGQDYDLFARAARRTKIVKARAAYVEHLEHQTVAWLGSERDVKMCHGRFLLAEKQDGLSELFSVVIPTYNRVDALFEAIDSVMRQSLPHWKLYVIDDCSAEWDRIMQAASHRYKGQEGRIWFFRQERNMGPGAARNRGIELARGKYAAFLDSDDVWYPDHLEKHYALHESRGALLMSYSQTEFAWRWFDEAARTYRYRPDEHPEKQLRDWAFSKERLAKECFIKTSSVVCWLDAFKRDPGLRFPVDPAHFSSEGVAEDWELFKMLAARGEIEHLPCPTARTHWAKNPNEEAHHSSRLIPWADFSAPAGAWLADEVLHLSPPEDAELTVIVPTRGRPNELAHALRSLGDLPAIVAVDGRDELSGALEAIGERPLTGCVTYDRQAGPSYARNRAAERAKTEWLWFLDDDDLALPGAWESVKQLTLSHDVVIGELLAGGDGGGLQLAPGFYTSGLFVRRELFARSGGFDEAAHLAEERELLTRLERFGARIAYAGLPVAIKTMGALKAQTLKAATSRLPQGALDPR